MSRKYLLLIALLALPFSVAQARVSCDLDHDRDHNRDHNQHSHSIIADGDFEFDDGDLIVEDGRDELMRISPDGDLYIDEEQVDVSRHQRKLLATYHEQVEGITDDAIELGMEAAKFGVKTAISAVFMALSMDDDEADEFEAKVEKEAVQFEEYAERICQRAEALTTLEKELVKEIPGFFPMISKERGISI